MANHVELNFMNALPQSTRKAATELYIHYTLDQLLEVRLRNAPCPTVQQFNLNAEEKIMVLNAVILTRLSGFTLGLHLSRTSLIRLIKLVPVLLDMPDASEDELIEYLQVHAARFASWYQLLLKTLQQHKKIARAKA